MNNIKVKIADKKLAKFIRNQLGIKHRQITSLDMEKLDKLRLYNTNITDLTGLEYATNLKELCIYQNSITDFMVISNLINLRILYIDLNTEFDITIISQLPQLRELYLNWRYINKFMSPNKNKTKISYSSLLSKVFEINKFTNRQRLAVEKYLFNPSRDTAIEAMKITPKANLFVGEYLDENIRNQIIIEEIQNQKVYVRYLKELMKIPKYKEILETYTPKYGSRKAKKFYMDYILGSNNVMNSNYSVQGYNWYKSKIAKGYIV
ncbi:MULTISPECIES: hypothetical protein [unclassified Clostridium]|uniref:hypothetical protein n=1 Tax=unclassified Clostridium TaxID=2614128 RepID=UPI000297F8B5|nr:MULTISPECIES: hypothetical protein [unclassified Clostridium]EKQ55896.1 MAG: hypothetical protein A370_02469 [Clostridium sp. Maddingley MBC34-26]